MAFKSLKSKLLSAVSGFVIASGLLISVLVSQRYSISILETMAAQAENLAHTVALEASEKILINDLVALQKMLDHHMKGHETIAYLFIQKEGEVLAHTFDDGIPDRETIHPPATAARARG